ncbi:MAG: relaxase/mobilization nuclease domain-containing protein [Prevotella sp.]|nr:relaxase/mobilization nuclease domain-containing protein [Prevotella sp.]
MIGKIRQRSSAAHLINYLFQPKQDARILGANGVSTVTKQGCIRDFEMHVAENKRQGMKHPYGHIALAWSPQDKDKLTDDLMLQLAEEYLQRMGITDTQYIVVQHNCTEHPHVHIAYNRIDFRNRLIKNSNDYKRNARICRELAEKYGLYIAPKRGRKAFNSLTGADADRQRIRLTALRELENCHSWAHFCNRLSDNGISLSFRLAETRDRIVGLIFSDGNRSYSGGSLESDLLKFANIDDLFGGELGGNFSQTEISAETPLVVAFDMAMELVIQPNVAQTAGGGGGDNSCETEDERKRKKRNGGNYKPKFHR